MTRVLYEGEQKVGNKPQEAPRSFMVAANSVLPLQSFTLSELLRHAHALPFPSLPQHFLSSGWLTLPSVHEPPAIPHVSATPFSRI